MKVCNVWALGRSEQAGEEGLEANLRRRCGYQLCGTLVVPGQDGRVDGGRIEVSFAIQSDGLGVESKTRKLLTRYRQYTYSWERGRWW